MKKYVKGPENLYNDTDENNKNKKNGKGLNANFTKNIKNIFGGDPNDNSNDYSSFGFEDS